MDPEQPDPRALKPNGIPYGRPFTSGDSRRHPSKGRPTPLNDPAFAQEVAEAFAAGLGRREMCEMFGVKDPDTITRWRRDPRVKGKALKIIEDRVLQVTRRVDSVIAQRLEEANEMTMQELLAIRKEFLGGALRAQTEKADSETIGEAQDLIEKNPELARMLEEAFEGKIPMPGGIGTPAPGE